MTPQEVMEKAFWDALEGYGHIDVDGGSRGVVEEMLTVHVFMGAMLEHLPEPVRHDVAAWVDGWDKGREVGRREGRS